MVIGKLGLAQTTSDATVFAIFKGLNGAATEAGQRWHPHRRPMLVLQAVVD